MLVETFLIRSKGFFKLGILLMSFNLLSKKNDVSSWSLEVSFNQKSKVDEYTAANETLFVYILKSVDLSPIILQMLLQVL